MENEYYFFMQSFVVIVTIFLILSFIFVRYYVRKRKNKQKRKTQQGSIFAKSEIEGISSGLQDQIYE